jgi:hypothetical protein
MKERDGNVVWNRDTWNCYMKERHTEMLHGTEAHKIAAWNRDA